MIRRSSLSGSHADGRGHADSPFVSMDRMYRYQRHIYDFSRKFYLLGRDRLLGQMMVADGDNVLEVGCGTGRNLRILARNHPKAKFWGLDASEAMLEIAIAKADSKRLTNVSFARALADKYDREKDLGCDKPFDTILFSYSISMISTWKASIQKAIDELRPGGRLYLVDFHDQLGLPRVFRSLLRKWLDLFGVRYPTGLLELFDGLEQAGIGKVYVTELYRRYALIVEFTKDGPSPRTE